MPLPNQQDVSLELYYSGSWHDVAASDEVFVESPLIITRGQGDESASLRPASISGMLDNRSDKLRTSNPTSPLYGLAGRNTPIRVSVGGTVRGVTELASLTCNQTASFQVSPARGSAWADMESGGILRRIGQWTEPELSAFRRFNTAAATSTTSIGYWPAEQDRNSTELASDTPGVSQGRFVSDISFGSEAPASSAPLMKLGDASTAEVSAFFRRDASATDTTGYQISWVTKMAELVPGEQDIFDWATLDGSQFGFYLDTTTGQALVYAITATGGSLISGAGSTYGSYDWTQWTMLTMNVSYSSGTTTVSIKWTNDDNTASGTWSSTYAGVPSQPDWWDVSKFAGLPGDSILGHVIGLSTPKTGAYDLYSSDRIDAWTGYNQDTTVDRLDRLCSSRSISLTVYGVTTQGMGPQPTATFTDQLKEIIATEDGLLFDAPDQSGLVFITRNARYNQTPAWILTPTHLPKPPPEVTDDQGTHNLVTAKQRNGGQSTAEDATGPLGTLDPPNGVGVYEQTIDVNVGMEIELPQIANWWLRKGTVVLPRYPQVVVDLAALPALIPDVEAVEIGSVIQIDDFREDAVRLYVLGYTEVIGSHSRTITFVCAPDQQYQVAEYQTPGATPTQAMRRYDSKGSTLNAGYSSTASPMVATMVSDRYAWSTVSTPYDWVVAGERITVTAMGAVTGSGPYTRSATVTRSVNGVVKSQASGAPVHMHPDQIARYAL